jgi:ribonuclease HI
MVYYAVRVGRKQGIYANWDDCKIQVDGFKGAKYKKFKTIDEARLFIRGVDFGNAPEKDRKKLEYLYFGNFPDYIKVSFDPYQWQKYYYIFTDGSHQNKAGLQFKSGYGVYFYIPGQKSTLGRNNTTNNYCEITAIEVALEKLIKYHMKNDKYNERNRKYIIASDSQYCLKSITEYIPIWLKTDWRKGSVKHIPKWKHILEMLETINNLHLQIGFLHVNSHRREPEGKGSFEHFLWYGNKCADMLATGKVVPVPTYDNDIFGIFKNNK